MQQESSSIYYMVVDEKSTGPFTLDEITLHPALTPETLVWKPGIENWVAAASLPELSPAFMAQNNPQQQTPPEYKTPHSEENNQKPYRAHEERPFTNPNQGPYNQPPYNQGYNQYGNTQQPNPNPFADNPQYQNNHTYHNQQHHQYERYDRYQNGYRPNIRTNWLPWAIVATVLGFFTSCIGAIFGIIGIVQANKANTFYSQGFDREGDAANSNARIMTIIGLIFAAIGIIAFFMFGSAISTITNLAYF